MDNKELYQQKLQAQLDEWAAEIDKLKAKASGASADAQLQLNNEIELLQTRIDEAKSKIGELAEAGEDAWESVKGSTEAIWNSISSTFSETIAKLKEKE
ncbi:MAG: coiled coil domain-containing protein [Caldilinea sp.]